jgi:hypothetical protein
MDQVVQDTFDSRTGWVFASPDVLQREQISNKLAYKESSAKLALIVKRSARGDFATSQSGLIYLLKALEHGALKDGSEVREAIVVLGEVDAQRQYKPLKQFTAQAIRDRFKDIEPVDGDFGPYWWILASACDDEKF